MICTKRKVVILLFSNAIEKQEIKSGNRKVTKGLTLQTNTKLVFSQTYGLVRVPDTALEKSSSIEPLPEGLTKSHKKTTAKRKIDEYFKHNLVNN